jgi:hypothetical protein
MNARMPLAEVHRAPQPVIDAGPLRLRPLSQADAPALATHVGDRRVAEGTRSIPHPLPEGAAEAFIAAALASARDEDVWAIDGTPAARRRWWGWCR